ncbi:MAG: pyruvate, phosphate dikinase [Chloroflexi bacterium]|nr:pyruvate, phosphate dikinase [Anaerolineae bacterium]RLC72981.1 MAG: pyruvate, phosphate dikinase [Chloroflexota bacterium]
MTKKWVYLFSEGNKEMKNLLGGKGAGLAEMTNAGLPVPPGFTITTEACLSFFENGKQFPEGMWEQTLEALRAVEQQTGKKFGDPQNPLLVSVRSGARVSMPGMMDTVLNLGLNPETLKGLARLTGNERFAYDAYRRFIQMFGRIVKGIDPEKFERILDEYKEKTEGKKDTDLTTEMLKDIVADFKELYKRELGEEFPDDPYEQLRQAIAAVFDSWYGKRAVDYRNFHKIPHDWGTAVNVVTMVFGNMGEDSGTGVAFTRNPATGEKELYGEYLQNAQGEDVVAGIRTPKKIAELEQDMPEVYEQFVKVAEMLEKHYRDMQDMEFTVERGKLWMLQTRTGKRTAAAAVKIAVDMVHEGLITKEEALLRVDPAQINQLLLPRFDPKAVEEARRAGHFLAKGLNASPGEASGVAAFDADTAEEWGLAGKTVILVRPETAPDDVHGMLQAKGILTQRGGATSHAAVVARGLGKPCVAGCEAIHVDAEKKMFTVDGYVVKEGDVISISGTTGEVFAGAIPTIDPDFKKETNLITLLGWADEVRRLGVWTNADYPKDAARAREFGAEGIGLCRTEHMFFEEERRPIVVNMIMAETEEERQECLDKLLPFQREDFEGIFRVMDGLPVIIRLIDPPMHEFLPPREELIEEVTRLRCTGEDPEELAEKEKMLRVVESMWEVNPMLGLRGCRAGIMYKGLTEMQTRAIIEAACNVSQEGVDVHPEIMIPLVSHVNELKLEREKLEEVAKQVMAEKGIEVDYKFGTMIEVPRAALTADEIARHAQFFSFGTNDLTQMTYGISRDDAEGKFLLDYVDRGLLPFNPFQVLDRDGVGQLMKICVGKGRQVNPNMDIGICGEHGGDPSSVEFCHIIGLNYVSCSPFRVPIARLAAAQAALRHEYGRKQ